MNIEIKEEQQQEEFFGGPGGDHGATSLPMLVSADGFESSDLAEFHT